MESLVERAVRLTVAQRKKRGIIARRTAKRRAFRRKQKAKRQKNHRELLTKANKLARNMFKKKFSSGQNYSELSYAQKEMIDKRLEKIPASRLNKMALRMLPKLKKQEMLRVKRLRSKSQ